MTLGRGSTRSQGSTATLFYIEILLIIATVVWNTNTVIKRDGGGLNKSHKTQLKASMWVYGILMQHCVSMAANEICCCSHFLAVLNHAIGSGWHYQCKCQGKHEKAFKSWQQH